MEDSTTTAALVVDLDGTLTPTDTLIESIIQLGKQSPLSLFKLPFWLVKGRANLKAHIADRITLPVANLPYRAEFIDYLQKQKHQGRQLILATAAHTSIANAVASHLDLFTTVLASDENNNLKGSAKLSAIQQNVGSRFVYAGDSRADLPIWMASEAAILVGVSPGLTETVKQKIQIEQEFPKKNSGIKCWIRALRVHQWLKNMLLFVPVLTAFTFYDVNKLLSVILAFFAFSLSASATYIGNDLWDLNSDRTHPRKKFRPFACAEIPILTGIAISWSLLLIGLFLAYSVSQTFLFLLLLYLAATSIYTWILKAFVLIDVLMLSLLYTLRIIAGSVAVEVPISNWLLAFSVFIFFSLALVKRCSELVTLQLAGRQSTHGRDYRTTDLTVLWPLGVGSALSAVVVFGLFINDPEHKVRYASPEGLWLVAIGLIYWLSRVWIKTVRGEMHDDPLVFAVRDVGSRITILTIISITLITHYWSLG